MKIRILNIVGIALCALLTIFSIIGMTVTGYMASPLAGLYGVASLLFGGLAVLMLQEVTK